MRMCYWVVTALCLTFGNLTTVGLAEDFLVSECMDCHSPASDPDEDTPLVDPAVYANSIHGDAELACTDCHMGIDELPHDEELEKVSCAECHDDAAEVVATGVHGRPPPEGSSMTAPDCVDCHGAHDILPLDDPASRVHAERLAETCIACHEDQALDPASHQGTGEGFLQSYLLSVHGRSQHDDPESGAATCTDCHGAHAMLPIDSLESPVGRAQVSKTCGTCHEDVLEVYYDSVHGDLARQGNPDVAVCTDCHGEHGIRSPEDRMSTVSRPHIAETCARCHEDPEILEKYDIAIASPSSFYRHSVHGKALLEEGNEDAAACQDCHTSHSVLSGSNPASTVNRANIVETCGACHHHEEVKMAYEESVHSQAFKNGVMESPVCTDCHGEHTILDHLDPESPVYETRLAGEVCGRCHDSMVMNRKFGLPTGKVDTYNESYHGLASRLGDTTVANCASCHEAHRILPSANPRSSVHPDNLIKTCGECHPGANEKFVSSLMHVSPDEAQHTAVFWVRRIYIILILFTIGGMILHNMIIIGRHLREKYQGQKKGPYVVRFPSTAILQHLFLSITFILLVITGFSLTFPEGLLSSLLRNVFGLGEELRAGVHRVAAVGMMLTLIWHFVVLFLSKRGRQEFKALALSPQDARDVLHNLGYHLGLTKEKPVFDRYDYSEKIEYWALMWGSAVMVLTGLLMWFPVLAGSWLNLSKSWVDVATIIHYYEAWLASLAILIWHIFFVVFHPEEYPMALSWLTGKLPVSSMEERHPKELERLKAEGKVVHPDPDPKPEA